MAEKIIGIPVPITLSSLRFIVGGEIVMGANILADQLALDVPGSTNKLFSFALDPTQWYRSETKVMRDGGIIVTSTHAPKTGVSDESPNLPRNQFSGEYDKYTVYLVPPPAPTPTPA